MMQLFNSMSTRLFVTLVLMISLITGAVYFFTVPMVRENVLALERHNNKQTLDIVYDLANRIYFDTESYAERSLKSHEARLKSVLDLTENRIKSMLESPQNQNWSDIFSQVRDFTFNDDDYIWIANYDNVLVSHPLNEFQGRDMSEFTDQDGRLPIPDMVNLARNQGEGLYRYKWHRLSGAEIMEKYSYVRHYPEWGLVIGAGVYLDEIEQEIQRLQQKAVDDLRAALVGIKLGSNGYLYVFDSAGNMLIHPNANIRGTNALELSNPVTGNSIIDELKAIADTGDELYYLWDKPDEPGNYVYEKLSLVRHFKGFDWYIASSVYLDDLKSSSDEVGDRLVMVGFFSLFASLLLSLVVAERWTAPIKRLARTATAISSGDLSAKTDIHSTDEVGALAKAFDRMVDRLRENIGDLNHRVNKRTQALSESNLRLVQTVETLEQTQGELQELESRQRKILDALPAQIALFDANQTFIFANKAYKEFFDPDDRGLVGEKLVDVIDPTIYAGMKFYIESVLRGETVTYELPIQHRDMTMLTKRTALPFFANGKVVGFLNLSIDITNERESEKRLAEASKMKAVGQMSGGIAHDFNNLLTVIIGNLIELEESDDLNPGLRENVEPALRAARRGADMTKRLLTFSRKQPMSPDRVEVQAAIEHLRQLLKGPLPGNVSLNIQVPADLPELFLDPALFEDAMVNIALNAADAMTKGGQLTIQATTLTLDDSDTPIVDFDEPVGAGKYLLIEFRDTGIGFSDESLKKALEPFYSSKYSKAGSGLGLSMVYGFVKQSQGFIRLRNLDEGASVSMLLPLAREDQTKLKQLSNEGPKTAEFRSTDSRLVLLVDDESDVRLVVRNQLIKLGYLVIEATSGEEAIELINQLPQLSGVVSDIVMQGRLTGHDVVETAATQFPGAFRILITGNDFALENQNDDVLVLSKPFELSDLSSGITQLTEKQ